MYSTRLRPLPLSNAERQRRYRARKIAAMGDTFLKRESERVKAYQKMVADMTDEEKANSRRFTNIGVRRHCKKKWEEKLAAEADVEEDEDWSTDGFNSDDDDDDETDDGGDSSDGGDGTQRYVFQYSFIYLFVHLDVLAVNNKVSVLYSC